MDMPQISKSEIDIKKKKHSFLQIFCSVMLFLGLLLFFAARWYIGKFGDTGFDSIIFTLLSNNGAAGTSELIGSFLLKGLLPTLISFSVIEFVLFLFPKSKNLKLNFKKLSIHILPISHWCSVCISLILSVVLIFFASGISGLTEYIHGMVSMSTIFEDEYVNPDDVKITFPEEKRNLIYIFLESMETTYFSKEQGGALEKSIIPELYYLADKNINFSHNDGIGGFLTPNGSTWTVAAMTSHVSGVPLKSPPSFEQNTYGAVSFLPGLTTLSDVLNKNGYYQALMVGSASEFANRNVLYKGHNTDKVYDLYTAREVGIVPKDYHVWWGMEDKHLFKFAKQELTKISKQDEPFAFSLLTVDTHFSNGYVCNMCDDKFSEQYENVMACSSRQVAEFVSWIKSQSFYKNTTIVIVGDHLTMDSEYIGRNVEKGFDQRVYNCIINSAVEGSNYKNRQFTSFDLFPTTLASMGCKIEGERLGLGTNLFSDKKTIPEEMGYNEFNYQLGLNSRYYNDNFLK